MSPLQKRERDSIAQEAARFGVDWILYRLSFDPRTRAPIEVHRARAWRDVFTDLVALDAADRIALIQPERPRG